MACGNKLFLSRLVQAESILHPVALFGFREEDSPLRGWVGSSVILRDLRERCAEVLHAAQLMSSGVSGRVNNPPYQPVVQAVELFVRSLSVVPL